MILGIFLTQAACSVCWVRSDNADDALFTERVPHTVAKPDMTPPRAVERVVLALRDGTKHTVVLSYPETIHAPLPAIIVLGGFDTGEKALSLLREDLNVIYATSDYPYKAPEQRGFVKSLKEIPSIKNAVHRTDLAVDKLIEKLRNDSRVDPNRMTFVGASFGAPFAITAAVRNPTLHGVILIHAFGRADLAIARQLVNKWGPWSCPLAWLLGKLAWVYLDYKTPEVQVLKLHPHQQVLYIYSDADEKLPEDSIVSLLNALRKSNAQVTILKSKGGHIGPGKTEMLDALMDLSIEWLKAQNLL